MADIFTVYSDRPTQITASPNNQKVIRNLNVSTGSLYYKTTSAVSTSDSSISAAGSLATQTTYWVIAAASAPVTVMVQSGTEAGLLPEPANSQPKAINNIPMITATSPGTDTACSNGTAYVSSLWVPCDFTITGVGYQVGSVGGTDKVVPAVWDNAGNVLGSGATAGTTVGTAAQTQKVALTATVTIPGNSSIWVGLTFNGTTAKFLSVPAQCSSGLLGNGVTQTFGTNAAITPPTTFTADKVPVGLFIY